MDEYIQKFLDKFGAQISRREVPVSSLERYRGRLPNQLLEYWDELGWSGYAAGLFWIVNPQEYEEALGFWLKGTWLEGKDIFHVIARSAFGELFLWGEKFGGSITITPLDSYAIVCNEFTTPPEDLNFDIKCFFAFLGKPARDFDEMFDEALGKLGPLEATQIYGFVPALALGGARQVSNLQIVSAVEHLTFLAQLDELEVLRLPK